MNCASLRNKATLEAMLAYSQDRGRNARGILAEVEALTTWSFPPERMAEEVRALMDRLKEVDEDARRAYEASGARIDARRFPDEVGAE